MLSLTMLLMVLSVMCLISTGTQVKDKMEVQTMADAAAYSVVVATARSVDAISMMNRVSVSFIVGFTAIQSLVSWSTYVRVARTAIQSHYWSRIDNFMNILHSPLGFCSYGGGTPCNSGCCNGMYC